MMDRETLEDIIIILEQEIAETEGNLNLLWARLESLNYRLLALDKEDF